MRPCSSIYKILFGLLLALLSGPAQAQDQALCWKGSYTRDVGTVGNACPAGHTQQNGLCYPGCPSGYDAVGPVCWQQCPAGFSSIGVSCHKPPDSTSAGYAWEVGDKMFSLDNAWARCNRDNRYGCYQPKGALIIYPNCAPNFHKVGDLICTPDCPSGMREDGRYCGKNTVPIGVGKIPTCGAGMDSDAGLCYPSCGNGFSGVGPVCWGSCPAEFPAQCGAACAKSAAACGVAIGDMALNTTAVAVNLLSFAFGGPGVSAAAKSAAKVGSSAAADAVLRTAPQTMNAIIGSSVKGYAKGYAKEFVKANLKNQYKGNNLYWNLASVTKAGALTGMNKAATEFGVLKQSDTFDLNMLTALDPTGISAMVMSFAKYPSCSGEPFLVDRKELDFGYTGTSNGQRTLQITAQEPMTITRIVSPSFRNCTIQPVADCIGKKLLRGQSCTLTVNVSTAGGKMDSELRVYTDTYTSIPYPIHLLANSSLSTECTLTQGVDETVNLTSIAGAWAMNSDQGKKFSVLSTGQIVGPGDLFGTAHVQDAAQRTFQLQLGMYSQGGVILDETGDRMQRFATPAEGAIIVAHSGKALDIPGSSIQNGVQLIQWPATNQPNQKFRFERLNDGTYKIAIGFSGKVLDVEGISQENGAPVMQHDWNGGQNQRFRLELAGDDLFRIVAVHSGKVLDVMGLSQDDGASVTQHDWNGGNNQRFRLNTIVSNVAVRRPWDERCQPGLTWFEGLCYDVPPNLAMTTPGFMGKPCHPDSRDDGTSCYPPWRGIQVDSQADPNGSYTMRHPAVVTSCYYSQYGGGQACPAGFRKSAVCSCEAEPTSKAIRFIMGTTPIR